MRRPRLAYKYATKLPVAEVVAVKDSFYDREVYVRVEGAGHYLVVFQVKSKIIGERVLRATRKCVRRRGKVYCYTYVRIPLPWLSKLNYRRTELTIRVYRLEEDGEKEHRKYLLDLWREQHNKQAVRHEEEVIASPPDY